MQLRVARLCLDCEELHVEARCPVCASEVFTYVTKWVPVNERRVRIRPAVTPPAPPPARGTRWLTGSVAGLALFAAARWVWRATEPPTRSPREPNPKP